LSEYLLYDVPQSYFASQKARSAQPHLNARELSNTIVPLPSYLVQQKIASISTVDKKIEAEESKKKALDELFNSLLYNLMTAKIRVNHLEMPQ
ncbi:MAG: restriction endonuclease subunit S, partial [Euryarchaeota archaeon]|nr:restriction endonuclease subunit S [Euryarchaeota archaeon]